MKHFEGECCARCGTDTNVATKEEKTTFADATYQRMENIRQEAMREGKQSKPQMVCLCRLNSCCVRCTCQYEEGHGLACPLYERKAFEQVGEQVSAQVVPWEQAEREAWYQFNEDEENRTMENALAYWLERIRAARQEERMAKIPEHSQAIEAIVEATRVDALEEVKDKVEKIRKEIRYGAFATKQVGMAASIVKLDELLLELIKDIS